jgi:RNA polymerase sigma factor (sigma-70 family)
MRDVSSSEELPQPRRTTTRLVDDAQYMNALAREAVAGDSAAMRQLLDHLRPTMRRVVVGVMGAKHPDLDDIVQQSLIALVQALASFRGECHPAGYASRIAFREALRARRRARIRATQWDTVAQLTPNDTEREVPADSGLPERRRQVMRDLLEELPTPQADTLGLRVILGWSLEEVAAATEVPINTVRSRIRLAKEALRRRIAPDPTLAHGLLAES